MSLDFHQVAKLCSLTSRNFNFALCWMMFYTMAELRFAGFHPSILFDLNSYMMALHCRFGFTSGT